jgi:hypothetical protein
VQEHIKAGKTPTLLGMTWADRLSFTLTDGGHLKKIAILDGTESQKRDVDAFDADVAIMTGTMRPMLADLISALGGECRPAHADEGLYQRACDVVRTTGTAEPVALASALGVPSDTARALLRRMLDEELVAEESPGIYRAATDDVEA